MRFCACAVEEERERKKKKKKTLNKKISLLLLSTRLEIVRSCFFITREERERDLIEMFNAFYKTFMVSHARRAQRERGGTFFCPPRFFFCLFSKVLYSV